MSIVYRMDVQESDDPYIAQSLGVLNQAAVRGAFWKNGNAAPSMIATLIEHLSHEDDPQQLMEDRLAQGVAAGTYLGGADTVSERNDIVNGINNGIKLGKCAEDPFIPLSTSELVPAQSDP